MDVKIKTKFCEVYKLKITDVKFTFDGEILNDNETISGADIDNDNIIDVIVSKDFPFVDTINLDQIL